ncbi:hypothetical protein ANCDUO_18820 [Ancylostoma duodenale]|uniref:Uncharacterized protein n=1 Tax=Ancylostoma duodenale TaxID=51022 RepID=A0A0C2G212_9BILA|nr:hypothetical protein ANCDUO_18820 [Ancylostoma duodenale]
MVLHYKATTIKCGHPATRTLAPVNASTCTSIQDLAPAGSTTTAAMTRTTSVRTCHAVLITIVPLELKDIII